MRRIEGRCRQFHLIMDDLYYAYDVWHSKFEIDPELYNLYFRV